MGISTILSNILISVGPFTGISEMIISFLLLIDAKIYGLFAHIYVLFIQLARAQIFDVSTFDFFINNIYVIFGVIALFILAFFLLQGMVNPDESAAGTKTIKQFIIRLVMAVFLTFLIPTLFDFLYDFQDSIISSAAIQQLVLSSDEAEKSFDIEIFNQDKTLISQETMTFNIAELALNAQGYQMGFIVLNGFLHPTDPSSDLQVDASKYFNATTGTLFTIAGCGAGYKAGAALGAAGGPVGVIAGGVLGCAGGSLLGDLFNQLGEDITGEHYYWSNAKAAMITYGDFDTITYFAKAVVDGNMTYVPIISTVAGIMILYMTFSFCLDLAVRAAKLIFYQVMAPISFLISTIPSKKDLMSKWFKAVLTTWLEVFIRIFCLCGAALLIRELNFDAISGLGPLAQAIVVLGLVIFAKQLPKMFCDATGIDSGNLKLGIKEKLAAGGAFIAGAAIGGGLTALTRNAVHAGRNVRNKYRESKDSGKGTIASLWSTKGALGAGILSTAAGATSGFVRGGKSGLGANNFSDMKGAAGKGAAISVKNRDARVDRNNRYKANDNKWAQNFVGGHVLDFWEDFKDYATGGSSKSNAIISVGGKFDKQWSKIKSTAGDMKKKKLSDSSKFFDEHIVLKMNDGYFKGDNSKEVKSLFEQLVSSGKIKNMRELEEYYAGLNNKVIESSEFSKYDEEAYQATVRNAINSVDRNLFKTKTEIRTGVFDTFGKEIIREEVKIDEAKYKQAIEDARKSVSKSQFSMGIDKAAYEQAQQKLNVEKSLIASMIAQIDKKSTEEVIDLSLKEATGYGLGNSDYLELKAEKDIFGEMFKMSGGVVDHLEKGKIDNVSTAGNMKDAAEAYKDLASKAAGEAKRAEIKKEARKNDDK